MRLRRLGMRLVLATWLLALLGLGTEALAKSYAIEVETDPSGAKIYLDDKDGDRLGKTPYLGKLDEGEYTLYIEKSGYRPTYETIVVKKKKRGRQTFVFDLKKVSFGKVRIVAAEDAEDIRGAQVLIDGDAAGKAPGTIKDVPAGAHQVEVLKDGYEVFEEWIEVEAGETTTIEVELEEDPDATYDDYGSDDDDDDDDDDNGDDDDDDDDDDDYGDDDDDDDDYGDDDDDDDDDNNDDNNDLAETASSGRFAIVVGPEVGNRSFTYTIPSGVQGAPNVRPYTAAAVPMLRVQMEAFPLAKSDNPLLAGWGLSGSFAKALPLTSETAEMETLESSWDEWDANIRFKYKLGTSYIGTQVGYAAQSFGFSSANATGTLLEEVPGVSYRFIRIAADGGMDFSPKMGAWASANYRIVKAIGDLGTKFRQTEVTAYGAQAGFRYSLTKAIELRAVLNFGLYSHVFTFRTGNGNSEAQASGSDRFMGAMFGVAYVL